MRFPSRTIVAAVLLFLSAPAAVDAAYTSTVVGSTATMVGDLADDTLTITQSGGLFSHNRFTAGDVGFNSGFDFDTSVAGDQTLSSASGIININAGDGNDTIALGDGINLRGAVAGGVGTDTLNYAAYTTAIGANLGLGTIGLSATLGADQENPPTTSTATGTATVSNYNVTTHTFDVTVSVSGLPPADVTGFHIHQAAVGVNGPIIVDFTGLAPLVPDGSGGFTFTATGVVLPTLSEAAFLGGGTYVNVHNAAFPGGVIRGQLFSGGNVGAGTGMATGTTGIASMENVTGGTGGDSLVGSNLVNTINGSAGADWIVGGPGADTFDGGAGADVLVWSNGDGTDVVEGGADSDTVQVNGSTAAADVFTVSANGTRIDFDRTNLVPFSLDIGAVETLTVNGIGGSDGFTVNDLAGVASLTALRLNGFAGDDSFALVPTSAGAIAFNVHGGADTDTLQGPNGISTTIWNVTASNQGNIAGLTAFSFIEALSGGSGSDTFNARAFATGTPTAIAGNAGADTLNYNAESRAISGDTTPPDGSIDSPGVQSVTFTQIETVNIANPQPTIAITDVTVAEGGTPGNAVFSVTLSNPSLMTVTINFATADGTATAPGDYTAQSGILTFVPGDTVETVSVPIADDALPELTETFFVNLSGAVNASIADVQGQGTITDFDGNVSVDLAIDFGSAGLWALYNNTFFEQLTVGNAEEMATGDIDQDGRADLIADFTGAGVWIWQNNTSWSQLHTTNASAIATGDLDGNGQDEVLIVFPGFGLWVFSNNSGFYRLHAQDPNRMILGDLDDNGQAEVILNFPGQGIWIYENNTTWTQLHASDGASFAVGDFDGGGRADLIVDFPGFGLWVYSNNSGWFQLHATDATVMTAGDIDGSGQADAIITFPGFGIWAWMNSTAFKQLHAADGSILRAADIDGSGRADVVISFPGEGIWAWMNDTNWIQIHDLNPEGITEGRLDGN